MKHNQLAHPKHITIKLRDFTRTDYRYVFDSTVSPVLNTLNYDGYVNNFEYTNPEQVSFDIEYTLLSKFKEYIPDIFEVIE